jgi:hypothetical protein
VQAAWRDAAAASGLSIEVSGIPPLARFVFQTPDAQAVRTLFTQKMLDRGFLASTAFYAMYAHQPGHVTSYAAAVREVFQDLRRALDEGRVQAELRGPVAHSGFARLA